MVEIASFMIPYFFTISYYVSKLMCHLYYDTHKTELHLPRLLPGFGLLSYIIFLYFEPIFFLFALLFLSNLNRFDLHAEQHQKFKMVHYLTSISTTAATA